MSFSRDEIEALAQTEPESSFLEAPVQKVSEWIAFITSVDDAPKDKHPLIFYGFVARILAQAMGSTEPVDFADTHMRTLVLDLVKPGAQPFEDDSSGPWHSVIILPAHLSLCLRVQARAQAVLDVSAEVHLAVRHWPKPLLRSLRLHLPRSPRKTF